MFDRVLLKQAAKNRLMVDGRWNAALVCMIVMLLGGVGSGATINFNFNVETASSSIPAHVAAFFYNPATFAALLIVSFVMCGLAIIFAILVSNVLFVGMMGWFMRYSRGEATDVGALFSIFRIYRPSVLTMLYLPLEFSADRSRYRKVVCVLPGTVCDL